MPTREQTDGEKDLTNFDITKLLPGQQSAALEAATVGVRESEADLNRKQLEILQVELGQKKEALQAALNAVVASTGLTQQQIATLKAQVTNAAKELKLKQDEYRREEQRYKDLAPQRESTAAIAAKEANKRRIDNKILEIELNALIETSTAVTATTVATQAFQQRILDVRNTIADLEQAKAQGGVTRQERVQIGQSPDGMPIEEMQTVTTTWSAADDDRLTGMYAQLKALTGESLGPGGDKNAYALTAQAIMAEAERDRQLQRELKKEELTQNLMLSQLGNQLTAAVANGRMTADAALTQYQQRSEDARFRVRARLDEAQLLYGDVASSRLYAASKIATETDLTKWLLERRVDPQRIYLRAPGTPVGGSEGQLLQPVYVDPSAVATRVEQDMQMDVQAEQAADAATRAVAAAQTDVGTEPMPAMPTIEVPNAADLPTGPGGG